MNDRLREQLQGLSIAEMKRLMAVAMNRRAAKIWREAQEWETADPTPLTRISAENPHRQRFNDILLQAKRVGVKIDIQA